MGTSGHPTFCLIFELNQIIFVLGDILLELQFAHHMVQTIPPFIDDTRRAELICNVSGFTVNLFSGSVTR